MREPYRYRLFGLPLSSAVDLPELAPGDPADRDPVEIDYGEVPDSGGAFNVPVVTSIGVVLAIKDVARFLVRGGNRITVNPHPEASARNVRLFLLGSAMGVLLHQRGLLPLHANSVEIRGRAVAFMGHSGAGKSTLAAAFHDRGGRFLSDDVCVLTQDAERFVVQPGIPRLRLWRDAVERSGRTTDGYERAFDALDKYTVGTGSAALAQPLLLGAIYLLRQGDPNADLEISRLTGAAAAQVLIQNTYRGAFIRLVGDPARHFQSCLAVSREVPIFEMVRPWNVARIDETFAQIEAHLEGG